jgi:ribosomal protein S18 acetylase RimI-like enzyme
VNGVSIRPAAADGVDFMWEMLYEAVHWPPENPEPKTSREVIFAIPEMSHYLEGWGRLDDVGFIAEDDVGGERLGAVWHRRMASEESGYGFVDEETPEIALAVAPGSRGGGIGGRMMDAIIESARTSGYEALSLSVEHTNPAARLYERHGFQTIEVRETDRLMKLNLRNR